MPEQKILEQEDWKYWYVPSISAGVKIDIGADLLEESFVTKADNIRVKGVDLLSDNGYTTFQEVVRGTVRLVYQFYKTDGTTELLCITDDTIYKQISSEWQYISNGTSTTATDGEPAGETSIVVGSITGFANGEYIGITLDDGTQHKTTINGSPTGTTIVITDAIPTGRSVDAGAAVVEAVALTGTSAHQVMALTLASHDWVVFTNYLDNVKRYDGTDVVDVPNMVSSGSCRCRALGLLENHLLLLSTVEGGTRYPQRIRNADTADPTEWDTGNAGYIDLLDNEQEIIAGARLGPYFIIYKSETIIRAEYVGSADTLISYTPMVSGRGCRSTHSIARMGESIHIVLGNDRVYRYRGSFDTDELSQNIGVDVFGSQGEIDPGKANLAIALYIKEWNEIFFLYATSSATAYPNKMVRLNMDSSAWTMREFAHEISGFGSLLTDSGVAWQDLTGTWAEQTWKWGSTTVTAKAKLLLLGSSTQVYQYDYLSIDDSGTDIAWDIDTKEFLSPHWDIRFDTLEFKAKGASVSVYYTKDSGLSWTLLKAVSLTTDMLRYRINKQFVARSFMLRFSGTKPGFAIRDVSFKYRFEASHAF